MLYVEIDADRQDTIAICTTLPYLDYRPLTEDEPAAQADPGPPRVRLDHGRDLEQKAQAMRPIAHIVPEHVWPRCATRRLALDRARPEAAVQERLTKESAYWDNRAEQLRLDEQAGKAGARLNSGEASRRADDAAGAPPAAEWRN